MCHSAVHYYNWTQAGADPGSLERGFICIKGWGFVLLVLSRIFLQNKIEYP